MAKCTGERCTMQYGYKVDECNHTDCPYRTEPVTNADRIRTLSDEEMAKFLCELRSSESYGFPCSYCVAEEFCHDGHTGMIDWLQQPVEEADHETG